MINSRIRLSITIIAIMIGSFITLFLQKTRSVPASTSSQAVALLIPALHPAMDEIAAGFKDQLQKDAPKTAFSFVEYNANGNKTLLNAQAQEIAAGQYAAVFTIGLGASTTMHEVLKKRASLMPLIFTAVDDPVKYGLVSSLNGSDNNVTGVISTTLYQQQIDALLKAKPQAKKIVLVYDPAHPSNVTDTTLFQQAAQARGLSFDMVEVMHSNEISQKVAPFMQSTDVILVLKDHTVVSGIDALIALCNNYGVTLYASDLNSADKGAALAFGVREYDYGAYAGNLAYQIIVQRKKVGNVPVVRIEKQYLKVNDAAAKTQGLDLTATPLAIVSKEGALIAVGDLL